MNEGDCFTRKFEGGDMIVRLIEKKAEDLFVYEWWNLDEKQWRRQKGSLLSKADLKKGWERVDNKLEALVRWGVHGINHYTDVSET